VRRDGGARLHCWFMMVTAEVIHMLTALVGIAATIYIFKFITGLFKPTPTIWRCTQVPGGCGYGPEQACECSEEARERWIRQGCRESRSDSSLPAALTPS
jgi:hypothetical protein